MGSATRALASAEAAPAAAEVTPAVGEVAPVAAEGAPAAEGEGAAPAGGGACSATDITAATLVVPGALGAGAVYTAVVDVVGTAGGDAAPAAAEAAARKLQSTYTGMPLLQAESVQTAPVHQLETRRALLNRVLASAEAPPAAEGESATAEGEGAGGGKEKEIDFGAPATLQVSAAIVGTVSGGPCDGASRTPGNAHAMVNQDVVLGAARVINGTQYFRIVDMFTPSRAKPQPDHMFCDGGACGSDDIEDAIGAQPTQLTRVTVRLSTYLVACKRF